MSRFHSVLAAAALAAVLISPVASAAETPSGFVELPSRASLIDRWLEPLLALFRGGEPSGPQTTSDSGGHETDGGPQNDPNGLSAGSETDGGPQNDPNG